MNNLFPIFLIASNAGINIESLEKAIKLFQYRFGLEVSGELDSSTLSLMSQPRCGDKGIEIYFSEKGDFKLKKNSFLAKMSEYSTIFYI